MAIVHFNIAQHIKDEFEATFVGRNKSSIVAGLMRDAIARERQTETHAEAIDELLMLRATTPSESDRPVSRPRRQVRR